MTKTTGLEFKRFYNDKEVWANDAYHDDLEIYINDSLWDDRTDLDMVDSTCKIKIGSGVIIYQDGSVGDFCRIFRKWLKKQTTIIMMVECPKEKAQILESGIKGLGGRII